MAQTKEQIAAYAKAYREKNKERIAAQEKAYREKRKLKRNASKIGVVKSASVRFV